jgi:hypothetical protein
MAEGAPPIHVAVPFDVRHCRLRESADEGPETCGGGLRPLRMKRARVLPEGCSGSSLVGLGERKAWS